MFFEAVYEQGIEQLGFHRPVITNLIFRGSLTLSCTRRLLRGVPSPNNTKTNSSYVTPLLFLSHPLPSSKQAESVLTAPEITSIRNVYKSHLESSLSVVDSYTPQASMLEGQWTGMVWPASAEADFNPETGVWKEWLVKIGRASVDVPEGFVSIISSCVCFVDVR